jgi:hypothetical protein
MAVRGSSIVSGFLPFQILDFKFLVDLLKTPLLHVLFICSLIKF